MAAAVTRKTFKYQLQPTPAQAAPLEAIVRVCRELYNAGLQERRDAWRMQRVSVNYYQQKAQLPEIRTIREDCAAIHSQVLQDVVLRVDRTFKAFFRRVKAGEKPGYPRFKGRDRYTSFTYPQWGNGASLVGDRLLLSKIGSLAVRWSRPLEGTPKTVTISKEPDGWYVCFSCAEVPMQPLPLTGEETGIDVGLESFLTLASGEQVANPRHYRKAEKALKRAQRRVSRRKKGSHRRRKAVKLLAKKHLKVRRQRLDHHHKTALALVQRYDTIYYEDLQVANLVQNHHLAKSIADAGWSQFCTILVFKAENAGKQAIAVPPAYTSQMCSGCGVVVRKGLSVRWHACPDCGASLHRDHNAALNILWAGQAREASSGSGCCVELRIPFPLGMGSVNFRDLNKNGRLDPYEDPRRPIEERVEDILAQMTLEEKAGLLFQPPIGVPADDSLAEQPTPFSRTPTSELVLERRLNHFNVFAIAPPRQMALWYNRLQALAADTRLGIPVTISSDPRHAFSNNPATSRWESSFSQWPEPIGLAAIGDAALVEEFGNIARQEYLAVGIRLALHPMADLATEPRWARISGTFGEDATLASTLVAAYIRGFQGQQLGPHSVACMTKHFPGSGPQKDGEDPHFPYGKEQVYPGHNFAYHLRPFEAALNAATAQIMPYYGLPVGLPYEAVGFGFNQDIITGLLREHYGFDGVVCTDWGLLTDSVIAGRVLEARGWGVEHLSVAERIEKALEAGVDQFGGEACPEVVIDLVERGRISEARIDVSVRRLLRDKFRLGLFDQPTVDPDAAEAIVGHAHFRTAGEQAQRKAIVLLKNNETREGRTLPLQGQPRLYLENIAPEVASRYGQVVSTVAEADVALLRLQAPFEPRDRLPLEAFFHAGDLSFSEQVLSRLLAIMRQVPTVVDIFLDRPAVIPEIAAESAALLANFGASDAAVLDVIFGRWPPSGKLPFELPSSMEAVRQQKEDMPYDSDQPLFPFGFGLGY